MAARGPDPNVFSFGNAKQVSQKREGVRGKNDKWSLSEGNVPWLLPPLLFLDL